MHSVLLVSSSEKGVAAVKKLLADTDFAPVQVAASCAGARQILSSVSFDTVIVNCPIADEFGTEFAFEIAQNHFSAVIIVVRSELVGEIDDRASSLGILTEKKPFDRHSFIHSLRVLNAVNDKYQTVLDENKKLRMKLDEIKLVNRAKRVLMDCLKMGEPQAHRYIEKQAMDLRITRKEVAETIIKTYTDSY